MKRLRLLSMFESQEFVNLVYTSSKLPLGTYDSCRFFGCDFSGCHLSNQNFVECVFEDCNLSNSYIKSSSFKDVRFVGCKIMGVLWGEANPFLLQLKFDKCQLSMCSFYGLSLKGIDFNGSTLREVDFTGADLTSASFTDCDLANAHFERSILEKADFRNAENIVIDPEINRMKGALFGRDQLAGLLAKYQLRIS